MQSTTTDCQIFVLANDFDASLIGSAVFSVRANAGICRLTAENHSQTVIDTLKSSPTPTCIVVSKTSCSPEAANAIRQIQKELPFVPVLLLGTIPESGIVGATGLISVPEIPTNPTSVAVALVESLAWSERYIRLLDQSSRFKLLNERELAIVTMAAEGAPNKAVASRLNVSIKTIEKNRRSAYEKLNVTSTATMATLVAFRQFCFPAATMTDLESAPRRHAQLQ